MFDWVTSVIATLGYAGIAGLTLLENMFPPIPSEVVIPLAGYVAAKGDLHVWLVIAYASAGSLAGAFAWYEIGRRVGQERLRSWVSRHGKWLTLTVEDVERAEAWFRRHGGSAVFIGRLVPGVRTFVSLPAGFSRMPIGSFLLYSAAGTVIWTAALAYAGVVLQANFGLVSDYVNIASNILVAALVLLLVWRYVKCWTS
jgi:membrane protein DedA with SNARE-associated domain